MSTKELIIKSRVLIDQADRILIGAGAGLSASAGLEYGGERFIRNFPDYIERYGIRDMYSAAFYPYPTKEEKWGYFSRHIQLNRYDAPVGSVYKELLDLVKNKDYFVITTNVDSQFVKAGFTPERIFATQGDYGRFQCEKACHDKLYDNEKIIGQMVSEQKDCKIPRSLLPVCPVCSGPLSAHLRADGYFVENEDWHTASGRYMSYVQSMGGKRSVLLELGVGYNTPVIIRWPFEQIAAICSDCHLIRVNKEDVQPRYSVPESSLLIKTDIRDFINSLTPAN